MNIQLLKSRTTYRGEHIYATIMSEHGGIGVLTINADGRPTVWDLDEDRDTSEFPCIMLSDGDVPDYGSQTDWAPKLGTEQDPDVPTSNVDEWLNGRLSNLEKFAGDYSARFMSLNGEMSEVRTQLERLENRPNLTEQVARQSAILKDTQDRVKELEEMVARHQNTIAVLKSRAG